jgi:uncharacterized protein
VSTPLTAKDYIKLLNLEPHPEGGWYREVYRSAELFNQGGLPLRFKGDCCFSTSIYFLLEYPAFSAFHRIQSDEIWHHYAGDAIMICSINSQGELSETLLGNDLNQGQQFQAVIPAGDWFAAKLQKPGTFALMGCTVAPGFDFQDFELGKKDELLRLYPQYSTFIEQQCL